MTEPDSATSLRTRLRLRELAQYYSATTTLPDSDFGPQRGSDGNIRPYDLADFSPYVPELSKDPSLTAIAQLAAVRLNCQRSFISLIAESSQHVVAEATRTLSPFDKDDFEGDDGIILGAQSIPLTFGICTTTIGVFTGTCPRPFGRDTVVDQDYICIPDLLAEENTSSLPAIQALPPILRFYLEVPLMSAGGYVIGSICVMDPTVKKVDFREVKILQDMSKLVMRHLELVRMQADHARAESLLRGLGHFIKGQDSIAKQSTTVKDRSGPTSIYNATQYPKIITNGAVGQETEPLSPKQILTPSASVETESQTPIDAPTQEGAAVSFHPALDERLDVTSDQDLPAETPADSSTATTIKHTFSRAANLIRQSMDLDATCFLEIPQQERYKSLESLKGRAQKDEEGTDTDLSSQDSTPSPAHFLPEAESQDTRGRGRTSEDVERLYCHRLAFSTRTDSSLTKHSVPESFLSIPANLLSRLSLKYPQGRIFEYDSVGSISPRSMSQGSMSEKSDSGKRKRLTADLLQYFPSARSLMFYPIYDSESRQLYAAYLGFTTNPARGLQKSELTYISGFTNSIMCEVMRLKAEATDNAKSDFISSISHELRSPLHGILASSQLLLESKLRPKQSEFLKMIETSARTLLDIMDHLLDYAKINHFVKRQNANTPKKKLERENSIAYSLVSSLNLLSVVEETTASMAMSNHRHWHKEGVDGKIWSESSAPNSFSHMLPIILNISPQDHWYFNTEAGSWRRIIMNLVGNSLKYTQEGYIKVELAISKSPEHSEKRIAELRVSDTGQGISREYLKHKLFTAFAQENNLSVGAGLGLSLVRKIVSALHGHIDIKSEVGVGTEVTVLIPIEPCENEFYLQTENSDRGIENLTKNKTLCFLGFEAYGTASSTTTDQPEPRPTAMSALKASLECLATGHHGFNLSDYKPDILVLEESHLENNLDHFDLQHFDLLVVDFDGKSRTSDKIKHANYIHMSLPIGPTKFSQAVKSLLEERSHKIAQPPIETSIPIREKEPTRPMLSPPKAGPQELRSLSTPPTTLAQRAPPAITLSQLNPKTPSEILPADSRPRKAILLVDDNAINLRILTAAVSRLNLEAQGTSTLSAMNGLEAVNAFITATNEGVKVPIVFMDISMPVMDGCTAARKIRAFEEEKGINRQNRSTIIAITGLASAEAQAEIENSGFDVYLRKPVGVKTVREIVTADMAKDDSS